MMDLDRELWRLGIPAKTRHNEVAPGPVRDGAGVRADVGRVRPQHGRHEPRCGASRRQHGLMFLIHEKPFAGHQRLGQAQQLVDGAPTRARTSSTRATTRTPTPSSWRSWWRSSSGVNEHADLLRARIADAGKDHRLGANEAPPAIMSIFLGSQLEDVVEQLAQGRRVEVQEGRLGRARRDLAAGAAEGRHGPQPDLAVRLHRQQVRVPGGRLVGADLLAADRAQHGRRGLALAARRRAREAQARRLRAA